MTQAPQCEKHPLDNGHPQTENSDSHEPSSSTLQPHLDPVSDNDASERPVREKLKKTSIAAIPKATITSTQENTEDPVDYSMSIQDSRDNLSSHIIANGVEDRGRPLRKRLLDDREATPGEKYTQTPDRHARKRSRDIRVGEATKPEARRYGSPKPSLQEEDEELGDRNSVVDPIVEDVKASSEIDTPPSDLEIADQEMHESILSPRKKRSRDQFEAESQREQKIAATDETRARRRSSEDERSVPSRAKDDSYDVKEDSRQNKEVTRATEASSQTTTETLPAEIPPSSGFSNTIKESPFGGLGRTTSPGKAPPTFGSNISNGQTQTSSSAFAASGFAALSASSMSPFGALGATSVSSSKSPPVTSIKDSSMSPFATLSSSKNEDVKSSGFGAPSTGFAATGQSPFGTSAASGFGALGSISNTGFGSKFGGDTKLTSFAAPIGDTKLGGAASKPFGASADSEDEDKDSDNLSVNEDEDREREKDKVDPIFHKQEHDTGEEGEDTIFQARAKLWQFTGKDWAERGIGPFKLNVSRPAPEGTEEDYKPKARFIMRAQLTHRVVVNTRVFKEMKISDGHGKEPTGKNLIFSAMNKGKAITYMMKMGREDDILTLYHHVKRLQERL